MFIYVNKARINIPNKSIREIAWKVDIRLTPFLSGDEPDTLEQSRSIVRIILYMKRLESTFKKWMCFFVFKKQIKGSF
ncbi:conserved hypothetical protein [Bacillus altitudinis]|uniref:Uncharacterized protein n=1 Tax=Bacillus altitudinis TaxID=293387 RepID=A0A653V8C9_BACAB|nr:conserved hypothetical protein [Bacillus altitudinis]VXC02368.1 conserved hypothetical protein [Bacillus altitudinis]